MVDMPIIGIILDYQYDIIDSDDPCYKIRTRYVDAIVQAGGTPILLPHVDTSLSYLASSVHGVIITGSACDVPPNLYNEEPSTPHLIVNERKTAFDIKVLEVVYANKIPLLAICYGMQIANVFFNKGTLMQHIPDYISSDIDHKPIVNKYQPSHLIIIKKDTLLYQLADQQEQLMVNSNHHQAVKDISDKFIISAEAPDGIIEAIESSDPNQYMLGIEWHPEFLATKPLDINIFKSFVNAAKERIR